MKSNKRFMKSVATTVMVAQLGLAMQPLMAATRDDKGAGAPMAQAQLKQLQALQRSIDEAKALKAVAQQSPADRASTQLARVEELVRDLVYLADESEPGASSAGKAGQEQVRAIGQNIKAKVRPLTDEQKAQRQARRAVLWDELKGLLAKQSEDQAAVRAEFAQTRKMLFERKLPAVILGRHDEAVKQFEQRVAQFNQSVAKASTDQKVAVAELKGFFDQYPTKRRPAQSDPKNLPWRTPEPTKRMPAETQTAWFQNLYGKEGTRLAQVGNNLTGLEFITPPEPGAAPTAADLAETPETQRTAAIVAKAQELGNNPVNIQNWVRNNVEWVPTWGAIQSAEDTLNKKRGNAIDIASLEIALLRAAKIPARYQFGTIELPSEQVMNWVGGVQKPEAAQQLLGQGGIANRGLIEGGRISKIRMEHAWVQAYVNWVPSRGAKQGSATQHPNPLGQRNAWVPMDASFKQYVYKASLNLTSSLPLSVDGLSDAIKQGAFLDASGGYLKSANVAAVQEKLGGYTNDLNEYLGAAGSALDGGLTGKKIVAQRLGRILDASLASVPVVQNPAVSAVPSGLRVKYAYRMYASAFDRELGSPALIFEDYVSQLVGKRISIGYVPATKADADALSQYIPKAHSDGSAVQVSELPKNIPAYLIRLKPLLKVDGNVVASGNQDFVMGTPLVAEGGFSSGSQLGSWDMTTDDSHTVGNASVLGLSAGGVSGVQLKEVRARLELAKEKIMAQAADGPTGEQLAGDYLSAAMWSWFAAAQVHNKLAQSLNNMVEYEGLSYGLLHAVVQPSYSWGVIRGASYPGLNFDIGHVRSLGWSKGNVRSEWVSYNRLRGEYMSALEHAVPERMFNDGGQCNKYGDNPALPACPNGMSAVKAIGLAAQKGQKIYSITRDVYARNPNIVDEALIAHSNETRSAIQRHLNAGMEVVIHESPLTQDGWKGAGYIYTDTATGSGGYIIEGGSNGGWLAGFAAGSTMGLVMTAFSAVVISGPLGWGAVLVLLLVVLTLLIPFIALLSSMYAEGSDEWKACFWGGFGVGLALSSWGLDGVLGKIVGLIGLGMGVGVPSNAATQCF